MTTQNGPRLGILIPGIGIALGCFLTWIIDLPSDFDIQLECYTPFLAWGLVLVVVATLLRNSGDILRTILISMLAAAIPLSIIGGCKAQGHNQYCPQQGSYYYYDVMKSCILSVTALVHIIWGLTRFNPLINTQNSSSIT